MSHTPGPWQTLPNDEFCWSGVADSTGAPLASVLLGDRKANAQLIAAAPEMLATLKHIKEFSDLFCTACERERLIDIIPGKSIHAPKCQEITEAIAKAEKENNNER